MYNHSIKPSSTPGKGILELKSPMSKNSIEFPMYHEMDIGLEEPWVSDKHIEMRLDDDVESDSDILKRAKSMAYRDNV